MGSIRQTLLADDAALRKNGEQRAGLLERHADAGLYVAELEKKLAVALHREDQQRRLIKYQAAKAKADVAAKAFARDYAKLQRDTLVLLKTLAEAQVMVEAANTDLPDGALLIADPELVARAVARQPRQVVSDKEVERWVRMDSDKPVEDAFQGAIKDVGGAKAGWGRRPGDLEPAFLKAKFRRIEYLPEVQASYPLSFATMLRLPGGFDQYPIWGHGVGMQGYDPALSAARQGSDNPSAVLARIATIEATAPVPVAERKTKVEWELVSYVADLNPAPVESYGSGRSRAALAVGEGRR